MQSSPKASCLMTVRDPSTSHFLWPLWQNCSRKYEQNINQYLALVRFPDFRLQGITSLLSISQQHGSIGLVEDGIVHRCITNSQRSLHDNDLHTKSSCLKQQNTQPPPFFKQRQHKTNLHKWRKRKRHLWPKQSAHCYETVFQTLIQQINWYPDQFQKYFVVKYNVIFQMKRLWTLRTHLLYSM